jgi:hypothetical protein
VFPSGKGACKAREKGTATVLKKVGHDCSIGGPAHAPKRATLSFYISKFRSSPLLPTTTLSRLTCLFLSQVYIFPRHLIQCDHANVRFKDIRLTAPKDTQSCVIQTAEVSLVQGSRSFCLCTVRLTCVSGGPFFGLPSPVSTLNTRARISPCSTFRPSPLFPLARHKWKPNQSDRVRVALWNPHHVSWFKKQRRTRVLTYTPRTWPRSKVSRDTFPHSIMCLSAARPEKKRLAER